MAAPDLHESFWVAIAAAAPVIGLASAVTADQVVRRFERATGQALRRHETPPGLRGYHIVIPTYNILLQAILLGFALYCLAFNVDATPARLVSLLVAVAGLMLVFAPTYLGLARVGRELTAGGASQPEPLDGTGPQPPPPFGTSRPPSPEDS